MSLSGRANDTVTTRGGTMVAAEGEGNLRILRLLVPWKMHSFKHISLKQS